MTTKPPPTAPAAVPGPLCLEYVGRRVGEHCTLPKGHRGSHGHPNEATPAAAGMPRIIRKKCWTEQWDDIYEGRKTFEYRREDDVRYEVGDVLRLDKWDPSQRRYLGEETDVVVTSLLRDAFGVPPGYVVLSIKRAPIPPVEVQREPPHVCCSCREEGHECCNEGCPSHVPAAPACQWCPNDNSPETCGKPANAGGLYCDGHDPAAPPVPPEGVTGTWCTDQGCYRNNGLAAQRHPQHDVAGEMRAAIAGNQGAPHAGRAAPAVQGQGGAEGDNEPPEGSERYVGRLAILGLEFADRGNLLAAELLVGMKIKEAEARAFDAGRADRDAAVARARGEALRDVLAFVVAERRERSDNRDPNANVLWEGGVRKGLGVVECWLRYDKLGEERIELAATGTAEPKGTP